MRTLTLLLAGSLLAGCAAAQVSVAPDTIRVITGTQPPDGTYDQLGAITAKHGGGCGLYGTRGNLEGAYTILRNRAAQLGADYVQILRVTEPRRSLKLSLTRSGDTLLGTGSGIENVLFQASYHRRAP